MSKYVDAFVIPVVKSKLGNYVKMAKVAGKVWKHHGALDYFECVEEDVKVGKHTSYPQSVKIKKGEVVVVTWITYKSRKHRDQVLQKVLTDKRLEKAMNTKNPPFDGKRMFFGGFKTLLKF